jgi:replicative superfamily II helicase
MKTIDKKINLLKNKFRTANATELAEIDDEMENLAKGDNTSFSEAMVSAAKKTSKEISQLILKEKLNEILPAISISYFAKTYFKKTPQWFYQRLNENSVNGKTAHFTDEELKTLSRALIDISEKMNHTACCI